MNKDIDNQKRILQPAEWLRKLTTLKSSPKDTSKRSKIAGKDIDDVADASINLDKLSEIYRDYGKDIYKLSQEVKANTEKLIEEKGEDFLKDSEIVKFYKELLDSGRYIWVEDFYSGLMKLDNLVKKYLSKEE